MAGPLLGAQAVACASALIRGSLTSITPSALSFCAVTYTYPSRYTRSWALDPNALPTPWYPEPVSPRGPNLVGKTSSGRHQPSDPGRYGSETSSASNVCPAATNNTLPAR